MGSFLVEQLSIEFPTAHGSVRAVNAVDLTIEEGSIVAIVGESGCGKSTLATAFLRLIPSPGRVIAGRIVVDGINIQELAGPALQRYRGETVSIVFQSSMNTFNPVLTLGTQFRHLVEAHPDAWEDESHALEYLKQLLEVVHLSPPQVLMAYPHELSGGMKQRAAIAFALVTKPKLLILDEPTTALDVVNQRLVLDVLKDIHRRQSLTTVFVTHDLGIVADIATHVAVMYAGRIVEWGDIMNVYYSPFRHPYVEGLLAAAPSIFKSKRDIRPIPGYVPEQIGEGKGCAFVNRCTRAVPSCQWDTPSLMPLSPSLFIRCPVVRNQGQPQEGASS